MNFVFRSVPIFKKLRYNLLSNVVLVFAVQQSESAVCIHISGFPGDAVVKNQSAMPETQEVCVGRSPGEGSATLSSILAWGILWTEEPGRLQSMGSHRVRQD